MVYSDTHHRTKGTTMNDEFKGLVQELANALIDGGEGLKTRDLTRDDLLTLSKDLRELSRMTKYLAKVARMLNR